MDLQQKLKKKKRVNEAQMRQVPEKLRKRAKERTWGPNAATGG